MAAVTLHIHQAWWIKHYVMAVNLMQRMSGMEPNWVRVNHWIGKGITIQARHVDG